MFHQTVMNTGAMWGVAVSVVEAQHSSERHMMDTWEQGDAEAEVEAEYRVFSEQLSPDTLNVRSSKGSSLHLTVLVI